VSATKKLILFLGQPEGTSVSGVQDSLKDALSPSSVVPQFVWARDGADAARKLSNQKFDAVVVDTEAARLKDGAFLMDLQKACCPGKADLIAIVPPENKTLPQEMTQASQVLEKPYNVDTLIRALCKALASETRIEQCNKSAFAVDVRVINSLLKSTVFICKQYGIGEVAMKKPQVKEPGGNWSGDIASSIAIKSNLFQGALLISFDKKAYLQMFGTMLGEEHTEINAENADAVGEICNMIMGNAKADISNYNVGMSLPQPLKPGEAFNYPPGSAAIVLTGSSDFGNFYLEVIAFQLRTEGN
jgi:CheY-specific phosphatase CheX